MNIIKRFILFLYNDLRTDLITLRAMLQGKAKLQCNPKELTLDIYFKYLKESWWIFLLIILAFVCGAFFSSQHYQDKCNEFIQENFIPPLEKCYPNLNNTPSKSLNISFLSKEDRQEGIT